MANKTVWNKTIESKLIAFNGPPVRSLNIEDEMTLDFPNQRTCGWQHQGNKTLIPNKYRIFSPISDVNGSARVCVDTGIYNRCPPRDSGTRVAHCNPGALIELGILV